MKLSGSGRRTLTQIDRYPPPREIYEAIKYNAWPYRNQETKDFLQSRDRAYCALLYVIALRRSEANRLTKQQFKVEERQIILEAIQLSKAERHSKKTGKLTMRKELYRKEAWIPLEGNRAQLGELVLDYLAKLEPKEKLFKFSVKSSRPHQIAMCYTQGLARDKEGNPRGIPPHWLRAYGENYLYDNWDKDIMAVASYVSVDARTLSLYIRKGHAKYKDRLT